jgi:Fe-S-cluster-containing hydrogenase component 2
MSNYEETGVLTQQDLQLPTEKQLQKGVAILECIQEIPCNPCVDSCPVHAISMKDINAPPEMDYEACIGCTTCVGICPGLAIFVVRHTGDKALITLPYEFYPSPKVNDQVKGLDREGKVRCDAIVKKVRKQGKTVVVTVEIPQSLSMDIRNIRV